MVAVNVRKSVFHTLSLLHKEVFVWHKTRNFLQRVCTNHSRMLNKPDLKGSHLALPRIQECDTNRSGTLGSEPLEFLMNHK
jgi:hypothetical protein